MSQILENVWQNRIGFIGALVGSIALWIVLFQAFAGPFAPQQRIGETIGEIVVDIHQAVKRKLAKDSKPLSQPVIEAWDVDDWIFGTGSALAVSLR